MVLGFDKIPYGIIVGEDSSYLIRIIDDETTGISAFEKSINLKVFPNPSNGVIHVTSTERLLGVQVSAVNGKGLFESNSSEMDLSHLPKGVYLMQLEFGDNKMITKRIIIE